MPPVAASASRRSLFERPIEPPALRLTPRDLLIARQVARFRFLTAVQIQRVVPGSDQQIGRRVRLLFFHRILDCPPVQRNQLAHVFEVGNFPLVYGLGQKGAHLIAPYEPWINPKLDWTTNNGRVTAPFLAHTTQTADTVIDIEHACATAGLRLVDHHQLIPMLPAETREACNKRNPFALHPTVELPRQKPVEIGVVPDRLLSIVAGDRRVNFALEQDMGTMDVGNERTSLIGKSSIKRKIIGYWNAWQQSLHVKRWDFRSFRVLLVTPSDARLENMLELQRALTNGGSNLFCFSTPERIAAHGALGRAWTSGKGEVIAIAP